MTFNSNKSDKRYAVILAGGDGTRLQSLTRSITGDNRPKQFCPLINGVTLLENTRQRVAKIIVDDRIIYSLSAKHSRYFERSLAAVPASLKVIQPENRGTAPAILYSLFRLAAIDPDAAVAFFPSDHYFRNDENFNAYVESAFNAAERERDSVVLLGIEPDAPETSYGWIEPVESLFGSLERAVSRVNRFWEKPAIDKAENLFDAGCLWNSFVMVGKVSSFLRMFETHLPELVRMFRASSRAMGTRQEESVIRSIYAWIDETNFSSEVLERSADSLLVMRVANVGWSDLGEPQRVFDTLGDPSIGLIPQLAFAA